MRFLANENVPAAAVSAIAAGGHDITWIRTVSPGASDSEVLARAVREQRILLTFDKDFGELAARSPLPHGCGVVLMRVPMPRPDNVGQRLAELITERNDWADHFSVITPGRIRMRALQQ